MAIGADPVTVFSAILPLPEDLDEMMIAGFLREKPVEMVKCETVDVEVPANAEIVLEGYVDTEASAGRRPVRRPHGLLLARRRVSGLPRHLRHSSQEADLPDDHRGQAARWKIAGWARRSSASFFR